LAEHREQGPDASIAALWEQARERALGRVDVVEDAVAALLSGALDPELADSARREAHKLAGSLGTFGMPAGTEHARALELTFEAGAEPSAGPELADHATALRRVVEEGPAAAPSAAPTRSSSSAAARSGCCRRACRASRSPTSSPRWSAVGAGGGTACSSSTTTRTSLPARATY
jgi:HPt (histidine-containing phosphotransfer) domain-containing protein